jgi:hypothetical protein
MAKRKKSHETEQSKTPAAEPRTPAGPPPGTVRLVNLRPEERDITLTNGANLHLWPHALHGERHKSAPVLRKLLPPVVQKMIRRGEIRIEEVTK